MRRLSILFVAVRFPLPLRTGDRARAYHQIRWLAQRHRVTLATFLDDSPSALAARDEIERLGVRVVSTPFSRASAALRVATAALSSTPLQVAHFADPALARAVERLLADQSFDLIHVQLARAVPLMPAAVDVPIFVDLVDALSMNMRRRAERDRGVMGWAAALEAPRLARYERDICARADGASVVSPVDRAAIGSATLLVNPNGVDPDAFPYTRAGRPAETLVFTGNLGYFPNVEAAGWCARRVMPLVWQRRPQCRLVIAGARPHRSIRALTRDARIEVAGDVPDLHPYLARASVALTPMFTGSGQLLKVLEAMATGTPVVATPRALDGLDARHDEHALVAETPQAFADAVDRVLTDAALADRLACTAHDLVESSYTWAASARALEHHYTDLLAVREPRTA